MKKKTWEKQLIKLLKPLPYAERQSVLNYYNEIYSDKIESGMTEEEIIAEFGFPEDCVQRILSENGERSSTVFAKREPRRFSLAEMIGLILGGLILFLPLTITAFSLILSFGVVSLSGVIVTVCGAFYTVAAPIFGAVTGHSAAVCIANVGLGITVCGVGLILTAVFFILTKYLAIGTKKALTFLYAQRSML